MKKGLKIFMFSVFCVCVSPLIVHAECSYERQAELNKIAGNVKFSYSYDVTERNTPSFNVSISNITNDIYVTDNIGNVFTNFDNVISNASTMYYINSNDPNCPGVILQKGMAYPIYNPYHDLAECKNNDNPLCNLWQNTLDYNENKIKELVKSDIKENANATDDSSIYGNIDYELYRNIIIIVAVVFAIIVLIKTVLKKKNGR